MEGRAFQKSLKKRWNNHLYRAKNKQIVLKLSEDIRKYGEKVYIKEIISVVRGKKAAF